MIERAEFAGLPEDSESLKAVVLALMAERDEHQARAREHKHLAEQHKLRAEQLYIEKLRLEMELARYKKWYYGPRADRLASSAELAGCGKTRFGEDSALFE